MTNLSKGKNKTRLKFYGLESVVCPIFNSTHQLILQISSRLFPGNATGQQMKHGPNKLSYLICFGIAPYFKNSYLWN